VLRNLLTKLGLLVMLVAGPGCSNGDPAAPDTAMGGGEETPVVAPAEEALSIASPKANVRFLNAGRMSRRRSVCRRPSCARSSASISASISSTRSHCSGPTRIYSA
jgi:hypothetical protein